MAILIEHKYNVPVNIDSQVANESSLQNTTSPTYINMPGMSLSTANAAPMSYQINFSANITVGFANKQVGVRLLVDGIVKVERVFDIKNSSTMVEVTIPWRQSNIGNNKTIKIEWRSDVGGGALATLTNRTLTIFGIS